MRLFIDTAVSDKWGYELKPVDDALQPHVVRLAWLLEEDDGHLVEQECFLIRMPQGEQINGRTAQAIGIYQHNLVERGRDRLEVMRRFIEAVEKVLHGGRGRLITHAWIWQRHALERTYRYLQCPSRPPRGGVDRNLQCPTHEEWPEAFDIMVKAKDAAMLLNPKSGGLLSWERCCLHFTGKPYAPVLDPIESGHQRIELIRQFYQETERQLAS